MTSGPKGGDEAPLNEPPEGFPPPRLMPGLVDGSRGAIARTPQVLIWMSHVDAYEQGCVIHVKTVITKHPDASREEWFELLRRLDLHDLAGGRHRSLEFARLYVYGTEHLEPPGEDGGFEEDRELEVFTRINAIGTGRALASIEESLLVTPSPPGRAMTVVADWPDADVPRGSLTIGMDAIRAATRQAIVL